MSFTDNPVFGILMIIFGFLAYITAVEWYNWIFVILGFAVGGHVLFRYYKNRKFTTLRFICNNCGYVAKDQRELHNHQITCEKKIN